MATMNKSPKAILAEMQNGSIRKDDGIPALIACLFDLEWRNDTRRVAAEGLSGFGDTYSDAVIGALGTTVTKGDPKEQRRLAELKADSLVKWLISALNSKPQIFRGQGLTTASFGFHWTHAIRVAGWLKRRELIGPLVLQLLADETGREHVEEVGKALANYGDDAVDGLAPLLSNSKLVWTRPALEKEPIAARGFVVLEGEHPIQDEDQSFKLVPDFPGVKAAKALKKARGWWNLRRFDSNFRAAIKSR